jgi:hypothetical protein
VFPESYCPRLEALEMRLAPSANVLTYHNDNFSTGRNLSETALTPADVNAASFGKLFRTTVDGQVYAQPLYESAVNITVGPSPGKHNVAYVATEHDSAYAIDADNGQVLWQDSFIHPSQGITTVPAADTGSSDLSPEIGITGTPVIDPSTNTLFVDAKTKEVHGGNNHYVHRLHAIDMTNGAEKFGGPITIADTIFNGSSFTYVSGPFVFGSGDGNVNGKITFNALRQLQRPALTLANGTIYIAYGSHGDVDPYHGWVLGYNAHTLKLVAVFNTTPNGSRGAIWQGGGRIAVDPLGNLYFMTGNGTFDTSLNSSHFPRHGDFADSFVKLAVDPSTTPNNQNANGWGLKVVDYFTPFDEVSLSSADLDLGSGAPLLLPDSVGSTSHPHLLIGAGKAGRIYLIDRDNMGKFDPSSDHVVERQTILNMTFGTAAYLNGTFYYVAADAVGKAFTLTNASFNATPRSQTSDSFGSPGSTPSISANAGLDGIVWDIDRGSSELRAYNARNYGQELYTSSQAANNRDGLGVAVKFTLPTIVNGKVYIGTSKSLVVYGLLHTPAAASETPTALVSGFATTADLTLNVLSSDHAIAGQRSAQKVDLAVTLRNQAAAVASPSGDGELPPAWTSRSRGIRGLHLHALKLTPSGVDTSPDDTLSGNAAPTGDSR